MPTSKCLSHSSTYFSSFALQLFFHTSFKRVSLMWKLDIKSPSRGSGNHAFKGGNLSIQNTLTCTKDSILRSLRRRCKARHFTKGKESSKGQSTFSCRSLRERRKKPFCDLTWRHLQMYVGLVLFTRIFPPFPNFIFLRIFQ